MIEGTVILLLGLTFLCNIGSVGGPRGPKILNELGTLIRLNQTWQMFSPNPRHDSGWFVVTGNLSDGRKIDLFGPNDTISWDWPKEDGYFYRSVHWRKYMVAVVRPVFPKLRKFFADFVCRKWNENPKYPQVKLQNINVFYVETVANINTHSKSTVPFDLYQSSCP
jgi:hypothetical protein